MNNLLIEALEDILEMAQTYVDEGEDFCSPKEHKARWERLNKARIALAPYKHLETVQPGQKGNYINNQSSWAVSVFGKSSKTSEDI